MNLLSVLNVIFTIFVSTQCYKPVVIIHGVLTGDITMIPLADHIKKVHPGTEVYVTSRYGGWSSLLPMWHQVMGIGSDLMNISSQYPEGINIIGYSQGGLIARGILEAFPDHNVRTFISLSSPQGGQYGTDFLHLFFPDLTCKTAYELFYSTLGQHTSVGNYWNDPHHKDLYYEYSNFLPYINNELKTPDSLYFKLGITNLEKFVMIGGPDDGVITPWESSQFGYYDKYENVVELKDQDLYQQDLLGLKTLDMSGRLKLVKVDGVSHYDWHCNYSVVDTYILPELD